ncbi:MAG: ATP-dependent DNA helicase RecG [Janthinobacterium lividum]
MLDILFKPIQELIDIKVETQEALKRIGLDNIRDLLFYKPSSYISKDLNPDLSNLYNGQIIQTRIIIDKIQLPYSKRDPAKIWVSNSSGSLVLVFFNKIPTFILNQLRIGTSHTIAGKIRLFEHYWQITHPDFILNKILEGLGFEPSYPLTYGLINKQLYSYILQSLKIFKDAVNKNRLTDEQNNYLDELVCDLANIHLYGLDCSIQQVEQIWEKSVRNLAKKELLSGQLLLKTARAQRETKLGISFTKNSELQQLVLKKLEFTLTSSQDKVIKEIEADKLSETQMIRLLQGDVGSGKTLVAMLTMLNVVKYDNQAALMAPTDLLANQHYEFFINALQGTKINVGLLTGKTLPKARKILYDKILSGDVSLLIGTHALFQSKVNFKNLSYIVIDEQHKFGVEQRLQLIAKSLNPDVLIMTATPIPRSLCLTAFGDMSISRLDSKPANRIPIITTSSTANKTQDIILSLNKIISTGEKIYWVCPLIDQKDEIAVNHEKDNLMDANYRQASISEIYGNIVGIVHGKMTNESKDDIMQQFKFGDIKILVATTIIEVGIDVPEATLIVIENAEMFGLAQLHQLRGRVGRGQKQSYCVMIYNPLRLSKSGRERLDIMRKTNDGFYIAEQDMILRGSGEILGKRQSGEPRFFFATLSRDLEDLEWASNAVKVMEKSDFTDFQINLFARSSQESLGS